MYLLQGFNWEASHNCFGMFGNIYSGMDDFINVLNFIH